MKAPLLVLASNSPRRRELLALGGWNFLVRPTETDESRRPGEAPEAYVVRLAEDKARAYAAIAEGDPVILAADTAVVDGDEVLGKPKDPAEATSMLRRLRGHDHQVCTGIAVMRASEGKPITDLCVTDVPMRSYDEAEIAAYVASGDPLDKAGAYAIQHAGFHPVVSLHGCYASVMGLPLCHLIRTLARLDAAPLTDLPAACQSALKYACPISAAVLRGEKVG